MKLKIALAKWKKGAEWMAVSCSFAAGTINVMLSTDIPNRQLFDRERRIHDVMAENFGINPFDNRMALNGSRFDLFPEQFVRAMWDLFENRYFLAHVACHTAQLTRLLGIGVNAILMVASLVFKAHHVFSIFFFYYSISFNLLAIIKLSCVRLMWWALHRLAIVEFHKSKTVWLWRLFMVRSNFRIVCNRVFPVSIFFCNVCAHVALTRPLIANWNRINWPRFSRKRFMFKFHFEFRMNFITIFRFSICRLIRQFK